MNLLVTGASGFIGRNLLLDLKEEDVEIDATYCSDGSFVDFVRDEGLENVNPVQKNLLNLELSGLKKQYDTCVFLVSSGSEKKRLMDGFSDLAEFNITAGALVNILDKIEFDKFIFMSSGAVYSGLYGEVDPTMDLYPKFPYAVSKFAAEKYAQMNYYRDRIKHSIIVLRFWGAFGRFEPEWKLASRVIQYIKDGKNGKFRINGNGENLIDPMYIKDAIDGIKRVISSLFPTEDSGIFDFCRGHSISVREYIKCIAEIIDPDFESFEITYGLDKPIESNDFYALSDSFKRTFNWESNYSIKQGIKEWQGLV